MRIAIAARWLPLGLLFAASIFARSAHSAPALVPEGTEALEISEGAAKEVPARNGSQIVCDDPSVAHGEIRAEKFVIVAGHVGTTLCGVRFNGAANGVYAITVTPPPPPDKK